MISRKSRFALFLGGKLKFAIHNLILKMLNVRVQYFLLANTKQLAISIITIIFGGSAFQFETNPRLRGTFFYRDLSLVFCPT